MARDTGDNVAVDFVWGNFPMQPNDDRGMAVLDRTLSFHEMAYSKWSGFPQFVADNDGSFDDIVVPNLVGLTVSAAGDALEGVGLIGDDITTSTVGATAENDGTIKSQSPAAGTIIDPSDGYSASFYVDVVVYDYVPPSP